MSQNINVNTDTAHLEQKIDQLVFKIYDFTEEEIQLVESSFD